MIWILLDKEKKVCVLFWSILACKARHEEIIQVPYKKCFALAGEGGGAAVNTWPVKLFKTVTVTKVYTINRDVICPNSTP